MKTFSVVSFVNEFRISKITYLRSLVASQTLYSKINLSRVCYLSTYHKKGKGSQSVHIIQSSVNFFACQDGE